MGNIREYAANLNIELADYASLHITYYVGMDNSNQWCLIIIQPYAKPVTIKCSSSDAGKELAESEVQKIINSMKEFVRNEGY